MTNTTTRDHKMKWHSAGAACGLDLAVLVTGIFGGESDRNLAVGESRYIRE